MALRSLNTAQEFNEQVVPELLRRWDERCFCQNANFLKLISFNFEDYAIAPVALADTDLVIANVILKRFEAVTDWIEEGCGGAKRVHRCPQCGEQFQSRHAEYSINMDRITARPLRPLLLAEVGQYIVGFHYFAKNAADLDKVSDFKLAGSVEEFVDGLSR